MTTELASRLTSGIITTLDTPDFETRVKIIERKSSEHGLALSQEILHLLAKTSPETFARWRALCDV